MAKHTESRAAKDLTSSRLLSTHTPTHINTRASTHAHSRINTRSIPRFRCPRRSFVLWSTSGCNKVRLSLSNVEHVFCVFCSILFCVFSFHSVRFRLQFGRKNPSWTRKAKRNLRSLTSRTGEQKVRKRTHRNTHHTPTQQHADTHTYTHIRSKR